METNDPRPDLRPTVQEQLDRDYSRQIVRIADHLHSYADRIQTLSRRTAYDRNGRARHVSDATQVLNELRAMQGNMTMLEQLMIAAGDAQREADKPWGTES